MALDWHRLTERVDAMTLRERAMIFAALVLLIALPPYAFLIEPEFKAQRAALVRIHQGQSQLESARREIGRMLGAAGDESGLGGERAKLRELEKRIAEAEKSIAATRAKLVSPQRMPELLRQVLARHGQVRLVSLQVVPGAAVGAPAAPAPAAPAAKPAPGGKPAPAAPQVALYRHGVEIAVRGDYFGLLRYVADLEALPWSLGWGSLSVELRQHPEVELRLTLYTLSADPSPIRL
jgi:MSHA biogenesis protein MshJ